MDADVLFPLFWKLRDDNTYTTVVGPWAHRERASRPASPGMPKVIGRHDNWLAPPVSYTHLTLPTILRV